MEKLSKLVLGATTLGVMATAGASAETQLTPTEEWFWNRISNGVFIQDSLDAEEAKLREAEEARKAEEAKLAPKKVAPKKVAPKKITPSKIAPKRAPQSNGGRTR